MAVSYHKRWNLPADKKTSRHDLVPTTGMSPDTMTKMRRDQPVAFCAPGKVCHARGCNYGDRMDHMPDENGGNES
ncbi:MAG: transcriptional regulator [Oscillospiraceae bacterium]|nr:transcriptional regulator [Oscillospiraceae bacterium]